MGVNNLVILVTAFIIFQVLFRLPPKHWMWSVALILLLVVICATLADANSPVGREVAGFRKHYFNFNWHLASKP